MVFQNVKFSKSRFLKITISKKSISQETGMEDPNAEDDLPDGYSIDEDGTEWFEDEDGYWWYRLVGEEEWLPHDE